jgi:hypothetical protein
MRSATIVGLTAASAVLGLGTLPANAQSAAEISRQVVNSAIQSTIQSIRDQIQSNQQNRALSAQPPLRFTDDPTEQMYDDIFGPLAYAGTGRSMVTKAPPAPVAPPPPQWGIWGTITGDRQTSTVNSLTTNSVTTTANTISGVVGADYTKIGIFTSSDAFVIGVNGSDTGTRVSDGTHVHTPGVGSFIAYINGGFSADFSFLAAFSNTDTPGTTVATAIGTVGTPGTVIRTDSFSYTGDLNYRFDLPNQWWIEPTVGVTLANTFFDNMPGAPEGRTVTVQGGGRVGTEFMLGNGVKVQPTFTGLAYSNVEEQNGGFSGFIPGVGGGVGTGGSSGADKGQVWGKGDAKFNFIFTQQFSAYVEGTIRGTHGTYDALGGSVALGARYVF